MTILSQKQLSLAEVYSDCTHFFNMTNITFFHYWKRI
jgi:hypothetical protein